jgi:Tfp pilus assembly protein PilV
MATTRGFSIVEAMIAVGLVTLALIGLFGVMPYTYHAIRDDSLRVEASSAAQQYMDRVRLAVQAAEPVPGPVQVRLDLGRSFVTGQVNDAAATLDLQPQCTQPDGSNSPLFDCVVNVTLTSDGVAHALTPLESFMTRQLP